MLMSRGGIKNLWGGRGGGSAPVFDENALKYGTYFYSINIYSETSDS